jgi:hypothetical protein
VDALEFGINGYDELQIDGLEIPADSLGETSFEFLYDYWDYEHKKDYFCYPFEDADYGLLLPGYFGYDNNSLFPKKL